MTDAEILEAWGEALGAAWSLARADRYRMIRDRGASRFDEAGLHPYSVEWGRILSLEALLPGLGDLRFCGGTFPLSPKSMRRGAAIEAEEQFAADVARAGQEAWAE